MGRENLFELFKTQEVASRQLMIAPQIDGKIEIAEYVTKNNVTTKGRSIIVEDTTDYRQDFTHLEALISIEQQFNVYFFISFYNRAKYGLTNLVSVLDIPKKVTMYTEEDVTNCLKFLTDSAVFLRTKILADSGISSAVMNLATTGVTKGAEERTAEIENTVIIDDAKVTTSFDKTKVVETFLTEKSKLYFYKEDGSVDLTVMDYANIVLHFRSTIDTVSGLKITEGNQIMTEETIMAKITEFKEALAFSNVPPFVYDATLFNEKYAYYTDLDKTIYTDESLAIADEVYGRATELKTEIDAYEASGENPGFTQAEITSMTEELTVAINGLVEKEIIPEPEPGDNDTTALQAALNQAKTLNEAAYTVESWATLASSVELAEAAVENPQATTQAYIDNLTVELNAAITGLVLA